MLQSSPGTNKLRPRHTLAAVVGVAVAALVAFWAFSFVVGVIAFVVKLAIVVVVAWLVIRVLLHLAKR